MTEHAAYYMTYMLQNAVLTGTGTPAQMANTPVAGKTGTTSSNQDRWFAGYTPYYTAVVWCGFDQPEEIHLVSSPANPYQRNPALLMWKAVMTKLMEGKEYREFPVPDDEQLKLVSICKHTGMLAGPGCDADAVKLFLSDIPEKVCDVDYYEPETEDPMGGGGGMGGSIPMQIP